MTRFGFTGEYGDTNGLLYLQARYYAPSQGRFFQLDPSRLELNPYMYSMGNPILYTDPSGYCTLGIFGEDCPPENYQTVAQVLASIGDIDFWYAEFWGGFATELVNITALNVPGLSLEIYNIAYDALAGCDRNWPALPTLDEYFGPRFQRGRWLGRVVALGLALGEVTVGGAGATLSIAGTPFTLGLSALGAVPSLTITAHGAVVVAEMTDPLILKTRSLMTAGSGGGGAGNPTTSVPHPRLKHPVNNLPTGGDHAYVPPKQQGNPEFVRQRGGGYLDADGNVWEWAKAQHGGPHWDVQHPNGTHTNVTPQGTVIGSDNFPR